MGKLNQTDWLTDVDRSILAWLWRADRPRGGILGPIHMGLMTLYLAGRNAYLDRVPFQANALTFITLLGLVPALAISFSLAKGLGLSQALRNLVINQYTASQSEVLERIIGYVERTSVGTLGVVGLIALIVTLLLAISSVEATFNRIWEVPNDRSWARKFTDYLSVLVICPLLIIAATGVWAGLSSHSLVQLLLNTAVVGDVASVGFKLAPMLLLVAAFVFVYLFLPNTKVPISAALISGLVAAILWWGVQSLYLQFQIGVARYNAIYGGFASLPLFLVWLQVSWMVLLFGGELSHAFFVCRQGTMPKAVYPPLKPAQREAVALWIMFRVGRRFYAGREPWSISALSEALQMPHREVVRVLKDLEAAGLIAELGEEGLVVPGRSLSTISVADVLVAVRGDLDSGTLLPEHEGGTPLDEVLGRLCLSDQKDLGGVTLLELAQRPATSAKPEQPAVIASE